MRRISDARLARVARTKAPRDLSTLRHRALLRARAAVSALLRQCFGRPAADSALAGALALGEAAAVELAAIPDGADLRRRDDVGLSCDHPEVAEAFAVRIQTIALQYSQGRKVDAATASPAELLGAYLMGGAGSDPRIEVRGKAGEVD